MIASPLVTYSARHFSFNTQLQRGAEGVDALVTYLTAQGHTVVDLGADMEWQRRGVDLIVDGRAVEVKSDYHAPKNLYFEVSCDNKPGCIFTSRADDLYYYFPDAGVLYILPMANVQWWLSTHLSAYRPTTTTSTRGNRVWTATGIAVPLTALQTLDMRSIRWNSSPLTTKPSSTSGPSVSRHSKPTSSVSARRRKTSGLRLDAFAQR